MLVLTYLLTLQVNLVLKDLWLNNNYIGDKGTAALAEGLKVNATLTSLNLYKNKIRHEVSQ